MVLSLVKPPLAFSEPILIKSFIKVYESAPDTRLVIVGDGPDIKRLQSVSKSHLPDKKIIFAGFISNEEKPLYYQMANIFLFSSLTDTQGIVILEAMASGLPIVALKDNAFEGALINKLNGFTVSNSNETDFANKTLKILKDAEFRLKLGEKSLEIVNRFSEENLAKKMINLYSTLISNASR